MSADQNNNRELLLYIAAKVARLDAVVTATHSLLWKDLMPGDERLAEQRRWALQTIFNKNLEAERNHLKTQFPEDFEVMDQYIALGEKEHIEVDKQMIKDLLAGHTPIPEAYEEPPKDENDTKQ